MDRAEIFDGKVGGRTLTSRGSGAWKEEMNMKLIVFRQVQPGATPCIYMRSPGKRAFAFLSIAFSLRVHAFSPLPPPPILSIFLAPSLSLSSLLPSVVFLNDFSHASCRTIPPCRMKQAPRLRQWTNGRRKVGGERAAPRQDIVLPYSRLVVEIATLFLSLPLFLSPGYYCIAYLIRYAF